MGILIIYGTTEGQTRRIASWIAARLSQAGHGVVTAQAGAGADQDPTAFDAILVAASLHVGHYQTEVISYVQQHRDAIQSRHNAFLSVSLAAASADAEDVQGLQHCVAEFVRQSGWTPAQVHHIAGAFRYTEYDFFKRWAMKYIAWRKGAPTDTSRDYELTDWDELGRFVDAFGSTAPAGGGR